MRPLRSNPAPGFRPDSSALRLCLGLVLLLAAADASEPPLIAYSHGGGRGLVLVNNPEFLQPEDLACSAGVVIHRQRLAAGAWRVWSSLHNQTGGPLIYLVSATNPGTEPVELRLEAGATGDRAREFPAAWNRPQPRTVALAPRATAILQRQDGVRPNQFFGGVLDLTAPAEVVLDVLVAAKADGLDIPGLRPMGYITRQPRPQHREARVYKGSAPHSVALLDVRWTFGDADHGTLPVRVRRFDRASRTYGDPIISNDGWLTNITIGHRAEATQSDMFSFADPSWHRPFLADTPSDALDMIPNFGNWGVVYEHRGTCTNTGSQARQLALRLRGKGLYYACQPGEREPWAVHRLVEDGQHDWMIIPVPAGATVPYVGRWVMGGPANGTVWQSAVLLPAPAGP